MSSALVVSAVLVLGKRLALSVVQDIQLVAIVCYPLCYDPAVGLLWPYRLGSLQQLDFEGKSMGGRNSRHEGIW